MSKVEKLEREWRNGRRFDVAEKDVLLVLAANGFRLRKDGGNHWLAEHDGLADHAIFALPGGVCGRIKINCHTKGKQGQVHPFAIGEILKALDHIRKGLP